MRWLRWGAEFTRVKPDESAAISKMEIVQKEGERKILQGKGGVSHKQAVEIAENAYDTFRVRQDEEYISEFDRDMAKYFKGASDGGDGAG